MDVTQEAALDGQRYSPSDFSLQDSDGYLYERTYYDADVAPEFASGELASGQRVRGWVTFAVREFATLVAVLVEPDYSSPKVVIADLTP